MDFEVAAVETFDVAEFDEGVLPRSKDFWGVTENTRGPGEPLFGLGFLVKLVKKSGVAEVMKRGVVKEGGGFDDFAGGWNLVGFEETENDFELDQWADSGEGIFFFGLRVEFLESFQ